MKRIFLQLTTTEINNMRRIFAILMLIFLVPELFAQTNFNVTSFGAVADGTTINTRAIQKAIDACTEKGGGTVFIPSGEFLSGTIQLRKSVTQWKTCRIDLHSKLR